MMIKENRPMKKKDITDALGRTAVLPGECVTNTPAVGIIERHRQPANRKIEIKFHSKDHADRLQRVGKLKKSTIHDRI